MRIRGLLGLSGVVLAVNLFGAACGSSGASADSTTSGLDGSKKLITLTDAEKATLCDWMVARAGSYGNPGSCDRTQPAAMSPFLAYDNQAACVADSPDATFTSCQATVAQLEACVKTLPACATLADASNSPACAILSDC
jgi:hypothetical protein